jgi:hypothetical protein
MKDGTHCCKSSLACDASKNGIAIAEEAVIWLSAMYLLFVCFMPSEDLHSTIKKLKNKNKNQDN